MSTTWSKNPHNIIPIWYRNRFFIHIIISVQLMRTKWVIFLTKQYRTLAEVFFFLFVSSLSHACTTKSQSRLYRKIKHQNEIKKWRCSYVDIKLFLFFYWINCIFKLKSMISTIYLVWSSGLWSWCLFYHQFFSFFKVYIMLLYPINSSNYIKIQLRFDFYYDRVSHFLLHVCNR